MENSSRDGDTSSPYLPPCGFTSKESTCNARDLGSIPGLGRSPGEGKGDAFQYSGLENSQDCIVHGVAKSQTWLSDFHFTYLPPEKSVCRSRSDRTRHGTIDWLQIGKGVHQDCILSPCLFNLYAVYTIQNIGMDKAQARIKIVGEISITSDIQMTPFWW